MKALMLIGARTGGTTDSLCRQWEKGFTENTDNTVEKIYLFTKKINGCLGCRKCKETGSCVWKDDADDILEKILNADILVFASPVYFYSITAQLKLILDRTFSIEDKIRNKKTFFITSAAAPDEEQYRKFLQTAIDTYHGYVQCYHGELKDLGYITAYGMATETDITKHSEYKLAYEKGKVIGNGKDKCIRKQICFYKSVQSLYI